MGSDSLLLKTYSAAVTAVGLGLLLVALPAVRYDSLSSLLLFLVLAAASEWTYISYKRSMFSLTFSIILPTFILFGPATAALVNVVGHLIGNGLLRRRPVNRVLFNAGQYAICSLLAGYLYNMVAGPVMLRALTPGTFAALVLYVVVYLLTNHLLVQTFLVIESRGFLSLSDIFKGSLEALRWDGFNYALGLPLGFLLAVLYRTGELLGLGMVVMIFFVITVTFRLAVHLSTANRDLTVLYEMSRLLSSALDLDRLFDLVVSAIQKVAGYDVALLLLWDERDRVLVPARVEHPEPELFEGRRVKAGEGVIGKVAETKQPLVVRDTATGPSLDCHLLAEFRSRSVMVVPLVAENRLTGCAVVGSYRPNVYDDHDLRLLTILGGQVAVAMENAILYRRTEELVITDPMTGLYNYRYLYPKLNEEIKLARASGNRVSLIYLDIDNFKAYNDQLGHQAGDRILREFAAIIRENIRDTDTPVRYGGDEFVVLLSGTGPEEARAVAQRIKDQVADHLFLDDGVRLTVSAGIATFPDHASSGDELIHRADKAMYMGKRDGNDQVYASTYLVEGDDDAREGGTAPRG